MWTEAYHTGSFIEWLASFFQARQLRGPDGRPLYEYQASVVEYQQLKALLTEQLSSSFAAGQLSERELCKSPAISACFVLFCAEWYRREYQSHEGWSWDPIWRTLGFSVSAAVRGDLITRGLVDYWGRELSVYDQGHRNLLGSIFREGGLPFSSLKDTGNRFQRFFSSVLKRYKGYRDFGYSTNRLVADRVEQAGLPRVFQEGESIALLAAMADGLVSLVDFYALEEKEDPSMLLDQLKPDWRDSFPIPLDVDTGRDFINSLLQSASREIKDNKRQQILDCKHYFTARSPEQLLTEVSFPNVVAITLLEKVESSRLEVAIHEGTKLARDLGPYYAERTEHGFKIKNLPPNIIVKRHTPNRRLHLVFSIYGNKITQLEIPNSFIDVGDVPLGFIEDDEGNYVLAGQASFRVKAPNMQLWVPVDAHLCISKGSYKTLQNTPSYDRLQLYGPAQLQIKTTEQFNIVSGASHGWSQRFTLSGHAVSWSTLPAAVYIGLPKAVPVSTAVNDIEQEEQLLRGFSLYLSGKPHEDVIEQNNYGVHHLSVRNESGETILRRKVGILPSDFQLELGKGGSPQEGFIWIKTQHSIDYTLLNEDIKSTYIYDQNDPAYEGLLLNCTGNPPPTVDLRLQFGTADPIIITLPFPSTGFLAFDQNSDPLPRSVAVEDLLGARLYLFGGPEITTTEYELALSLKGEKPLNLSMYWKVKVPDTPKEIELFPLRDEIEQLLSLQRGIDRYVELTVNGRSVCRIRRYATDLRLDLQRWVLEELNTVAQNEAQPEPVLMCLSEPERLPLPIPARQSQGVELPIYDLPQHIDATLPWLVIPREGSSLSFRPELIHFSEQTLSEETISLNSAPTKSIRQILRNQGSAANVGALDALIAQMATDAQHKGWHYIKALYENYGYLPLATFDAWLALMRHPRAIAMAAFHFEMNPAFIQRLARRFPFTWELFPIRDFLAAEQAFFSYLTDRGLPEERQGELRKRLYERLAEATPTYSDEVLSWLLNNKMDIVLPPINAMQSLIGSWYRSLLQDRATAVWPDIAAHNALKQWAMQQDMCVPETELNHRNTVTYMPYFAAGVATGRINGTALFQNESELIFHLRQARDFDSRWFYAIYRYALLHFLKLGPLP